MTANGSADVQVRSSIPAAPDVVPDRSVSILHEHSVEQDRLSNLVGHLAEVLQRDLPPSVADRRAGADLEADNRIQAEIDRIRTWFLAGVGEFASRTWLTPPIGEQLRYPGTAETYRYCYDRQHTAAILERRVQASGPDLGRRKYAMLCSSGMAAINTLLQALAFLTEPEQRRMGAFASYFETHSLFRMSAFAKSWSRIKGSDQLLDAIRHSQFPIVYLEPVQYNWSLDVTPLSELTSAVCAAAQPPIIILDTTLSGETPVVDRLLSSIAASPCPLLVRVRSGLKLDQEGLEFASVGALEWWPRTEVAARFERLEPLADTFRTVSGAGLNRLAACALSPFFVFDRARTRSFAEAVFASNRTLFDELDLGGALFSSKIYPPRPWDSPFVLLKLERGGSTEYVRLAALIAREATRRGLGWMMSGSFGFRTERFETIVPGEQPRFGEPSAGVLKIAAGCYRGARFWSIVDLLNELARFDSLDDAEFMWRMRGAVGP
jgi:hypothetical protein